MSEKQDTCVRLNVYGMLFLMHRRPPRATRLYTLFPYTRSSDLPELKRRFRDRVRGEERGRVLDLPRLGEVPDTVGNVDERRRREARHDLVPEIGRAYV